MARNKDRLFEDSDLAAIIGGEIESAKAYYASEIDNRRSLALEYMQGRMRDVPVLPNRSRLVSRDVADTISWIQPGVVRVFTSSDQMVEYECTREGGEQWARDATEFMNHDFMRNNDGYRILYNSTYDALSLSDAVVSSEWVPEERKRETLRRQTLEQIAILEQEDGVEVLTAKELDETYEYETMDEMGMPAIAVAPYLDIKISRIVKRGHIKDYTLRPENLLINDSATTIESARFVGYRYDDKTRSDLMVMADTYGWDKERIKELPADGYAEDSPVEQSRQLDSLVNYYSPVSSGDPIDLYRCFEQLDVDGDGIAETIEVWYAGDEVLSWDVWEDEIPYTTIPCYPIPHRFDGESVADRTMDIQRAKTVLLRQGMDNIYATNVPTQEVDVGSVLNPDALVNKKFGSIIWKKAGTADVRWGTVPFTADKVFTAMNYMDEVIAKRTGVSRTTMALDPEALQNQTATAAQQQRDAGYSQVELIARNMAELGWTKFFRKRLKLAVKYGEITQIPAPKEDAQFRTVDPRQWPDDMGVSINVGLGTGSKDRDMSMLNVMMNTQTAMAQQLAQVPGAQAKAIEFVPKILKTAIKMAESSGLRNPEAYFPVINDQDVMQWQQTASQPQPDPKVQIEQAKLRADQQRAQGQMQIDMQKASQSAQLETQKQMGNFELEREKMAMQMQLEREKQASDLQLKREQLNAELALKREQLIAELALKRELGVAANAVAGTSAVRPGGDPG